MKQVMDTALSPPPAVPAPKRGKDTLVLTKKLLEGFLREMRQTGRSAATVESYRQNLLAYYEFLPPDKRLDRTTLPAWREALLAGAYSASSINSKTSTVNSFYNYLGRRDWQITNLAKAQPEEAQELTRQEYRLLLAQAQRQQDIQLYLLVKVLACTDLIPSDLVLLTREALEEGQVRGKMRGTDRLVPIPAALLGDLREFALYRNIRTGPIFRSASGKPFVRTAVTKLIGALGAELGLDPGKATPRNLHRLYLSTLADFQRQADAWVAQSYAALLAQEEAQIAWDPGRRDP